MSLSSGRRCGEGEEERGKEGERWGREGERGEERENSQRIDLVMI